jgi:hypothetical protein
MPLTITPAATLEQLLKSASVESRSGSSSWLTWQAGAHQLSTKSAIISKSRLIPMRVYVGQGQYLCDETY